MFPSIAAHFVSNSDEFDVEERLIRRSLRDATDVLQIPDKLFMQSFRVNKEIFLMLLEEVEPKIQTYRSTHIPSPIKLATFLNFLATGSYQLSLGNERQSSMCKSSVSKIIKEYLNIFEETFCQKWITLNRSEEQENKTKQHFYNAAGIPGIVGCVDGTHIRIKSPGDDVKHLYYNHKGFYSINAMMICDENMVFLYVDARHPGSNHDSFVWDNCSADYFFKYNYLNGKRNTWILGDSGYKLLPYVMTPFRNPVDENQKKYNERHCKLRNVIERSYGVLKNRFRCIIGSRGLHYNPGKVTQMVNVVCALHNMCIFFKNDWVISESLEENVYENDADVSLEESPLSSVANSIRYEIARNLQ